MNDYIVDYADVFTKCCFRCPYGMRCKNCFEKIHMEFMKMELENNVKNKVLMI